jgi:hypothetical protein
MDLSNHKPVTVATSVDEMTEMLELKMRYDALEVEHQALKMLVESETKLTDFTKSALFFLQDCMKQAMNEAEFHISELLKLGVDPESERVKFWQQESDHAALWLTQSKTASVIVNHEEKLNQN